MRLQYKLIIVFLAISIIPLIGVGFGIYTNLPNYKLQISALDPLLLFGFITIVIVIASVIFISYITVKSIYELNNASKEIAKGNLDIEIPGTLSKDEVGELARSFHEMKEKLKQLYINLDASNQQLKASNQQLDASNQQLRAANEQLVAGGEILKEKIHQLEIFNKATIGRELQMIELKKEIEELKEKNTKNYEKQ